ncbi:putative toxin-antitoxin system toxin component, PIN family [Algoriphagus locisalis]|uniref:Putative toxin-antitoxin system toxin component, PIN family n=1 Tax=Algoriphagus locisalis TaxID=305507 RepID=A0A1I7E199_9BACT|nr:putative toxin-antitoxin system toxin component, PIN family [Algoriphagus locisalis]SFU17697.1 putative toxin-antitoxin system toxin component, PIN family [Algoriphagus locisalis]
MKVVIDTNIIFSVLLNSEGTIGDLLFNSDEKFEFYSCAYMRSEIRIHWEKLKKISALSEEQLQVSYDLVLSKLKFINEEIIPSDTWLVSEKLTKPIDPDDIAFVALTLFLEATLWTGDKILYSGLKNNGSQNVVNTKDLLAIRQEK